MGGGAVQRHDFGTLCLARAVNIPRRNEHAVWFEDAGAPDGHRALAGIEGAIAAQLTIYRRESHLTFRHHHRSFKAGLDICVHEDGSLSVEMA